MKKKLLSILLASIMVISLLTGCVTTDSSVGGAEESVSNTSAEDAAGEEPASEDSASADDSVEETDVVTTLSFGTHIADLEAQEPQVYEVIQAFMAANQDVKIEITATSDANEQTTAMKLAAESGTLPDIFWNNPAASAEMFAAGYLMDLNEFLEYDAAVNASIGDALRSLDSNGVVSGLPYQKLVTGFWINKDLFEQYGLEVPHSGTTFEEMLEFVKVFQENGVTVISNGAKTPYSVWAFLSAWVRYGFFEHLDGILAGSDSFVNEDFINYFQMIADLRDSGAFPSNITTQDYFQGKDAFLAGNAAMMDSGLWDSTPINESLGESTGFWWGPTFANGVGDQNVGMQAFTNNLRVSAAVGEDEVKKDAVFRFLSFWLSEDADRIRIGNGTVPIATNPDVEVDNKAYGAILDAISDEGWSGSPRQPDLVVSEPVMNAMYDAIYGVMSDIYTPQQACENIQAAQER